MATLSRKRALQSWVAKYVPIDQAAKYRARGWTVRSLADCHHGAYSVLVVKETAAKVVRQAPRRSRQ